MTHSRPRLGTRRLAVPLEAKAVTLHDPHVISASRIVAWETSLDFWMMIRCPSCFVLCFACTLGAFSRIFSLSARACPSVASPTLVDFFSLVSTMLSASTLLVASVITTLALSI